MFSAMAFASIIGWLSILNIIYVLGGIINFVAGIWGIVVTVVIVRKTNALSTGKAIAVVLIPIIIVTILAVIFAALAAVFLGAGLLGAMGTG